MINLFTGQKPSISHARSQTLPNIHNAEDTDDILLSDIEQDLCNHTLQYSCEVPTSHHPTEPRKTHQRTLTGQSRSSRDLPPLVTSLSYNQSRASQSSPTERIFSNPAAKPRFPLDDPEPISQQSPTRSGTRSDGLQTEPKVAKIANWFQGQSEPINVSLVRPSPKQRAASQDELNNRSNDKLPTTTQRKQTSTGNIKPAMASRFSFFSSKMSLAKSTSSPSDPNDEFLSMDVNFVLNQSGTSDPLSPTSTKNFQQQAEGLLSRLQKAYKERCQALRDIVAEKEVLVEENQGAETRAQHLKLQLDNMAAKVAEQDEAMMNLVDELAKEKLARREEEEARKRTVKLVDRDRGGYRAPAHGRVSWSNSISDSGFESEDDSSADSVFSRRNGMHSPTMSLSSVSTNSPDIYKAPDFANVPTRAARLRIPQNPGSLVNSTAGISNNATPSHCANCNGVKSSEARGMVGKLKEENQGLVQRVAELESALDGCLDVVGRLGA